MSILHLASTNNVPDKGELARHIHKCNVRRGAEDYIYEELKRPFLNILQPIRLASKIRNLYTGISSIYCYSAADLEVALNTNKLLEDPLDIIFIKLSRCEDDNIYRLSKTGNFQTLIPKPEQIQGIGNVLVPEKPYCKLTDNQTHRYIYIGDINDTSTVNKILDWFKTDATDSYELTIYGEGAGRYVMPMIKRSRQFPKPVNWPGAIPDEPFISVNDIFLAPNNSKLNYDIWLERMKNSGITVIHI